MHILIIKKTDLILNEIIRFHILGTHMEEAGAEVTPATTIL
jgi:hypothetical protein